MLPTHLHEPPTVRRRDAGPIRSCACCRDASMRVGEPRCFSWRVKKHDRGRQEKRFSLRRAPGKRIFGKMKEKDSITIFSHDLSGNCLGRALVFADCLKSDYRVRIVGPLRRGREIWRVARGYNDEVIHPVTFHKAPFHTYTLRAMMDGLRCEWIIAVKPYPSSFGAALLAKKQYGAKVLLDLDDDEIALLAYQKSFGEKYFHLNPNKLLGVQRLLQQIGKADALTTASLTLNRRYGGVLFPHMRDPNFFDLDVDREELRPRLGLPRDKFVVSHFGSFRSYKGLEKAVEAVRILNDRDVLLVYTAEENKFPSCTFVKRIPEFPLLELPAMLKASDFALFPSIHHPAALAQLPAKIIDAMMAGVPFLASRNENIAHVVQDEDLLFDVDATPEEIAERIAYFKAHPDLRQMKSLALRTRASTEFTLSAGRRALQKIFGKHTSEPEGS